MARKRLTIASWLLLLFAVAFAGAFGVLVHWGGRIESILLVFGTPVYVDLDAGRPGTLLFFGLPALLVAAAFALRKPR